MPQDIDLASEEEIIEAWNTAMKDYLLFEVDSNGTLSLANFEESMTRAVIHDYSSVSEVLQYHIEDQWSLGAAIRDAYEDKLKNSEFPVLDPDTGEHLSERDIEHYVEEEWLDWVTNASGSDRQLIEDVVQDWLDGEPDWLSEQDEIPGTASAEGSAYDYFVHEDHEITKALGIVVIEGEHPGSSYFAAELRISPEEANKVAMDNGWDVRFVRKDQADR